MKKEQDEKKKTDRLKTEDHLSWLESYSAWWAELQLQPSAFIWPIVSSTRRRAPATVSNIEPWWVKDTCVTSEWSHWMLIARSNQTHLEDSYSYLKNSKAGVECAPWSIHKTMHESVEWQQSILAHQNSLCHFLCSLPSVLFLCLKAELESAGHTSVGFDSKHDSFLMRTRWAYNISRLKSLLFVRLTPSEADCIVR